jgi:hypothetical protein
MPSTRRWSVPPKRIAATAVLGVIGIFLVCGSVGMGAWLVGALGIAVIAVGAGLFILSALNSRATSMIEGTAHVLSVSAPPTGVTHGRCRLHLALDGKGIEKIAVRIRDAAVPVDKWPDAGADLPVMITIDKPQRTRVLWADVATHRELAEARARAREADEQAAAMAAEDDEYANLDAALDNLDNRDIDEVAEPRPAEPPIAESSLDEPPLAGSSVAEPLGSDPTGEPYQAGESIRDGGEPAMATTGTRTIEMDLIDPSVMRWTGPPPRRPHGSRPSPFRRRRSERDGPTESAPDESSPDVVEARSPDDAEPALSEPALSEPELSEPEPAEPEPAEPEPAEPEPAEPEPAVAGPLAVAAVDNDMSAVAPEVATTLAPTRNAQSGLMVDNGQIVGFDLFESASAAGPVAAVTSRSSPPEWPPRSAAAVAAAAALPHQWDDEDIDDLTVAAEAAEAVSEVALTAGTGDGDSGSGARRVPRNRPAPADEVFDQEAPDDGPGYSPDAGYAHDADYEPDAGYSSDAGYAEPGPPNSAS